MYKKQLLEQRASDEVGHKEKSDLFREEFCIWKQNIFWLPVLASVLKKKSQTYITGI